MKEKTLVTLKDERSFEYPFSDDTIYMNDLGVLGSIEMKRIASDVYEFVKHSGEGIDWRT